MLSLSPTNNWEKRDITLPSCNKISGSQQSFFQDRNGHFMICIVKWWKKSPKCNHRKVIQSYFFLPYNCRATVCWDPGILLSLYICHCCSFCYCPFLINIKLGLFWTLPSLTPSLEVPKVNEHRGHEIESLQYNNEILGIISPYGNSMLMAISQDSVQT